MQKTTSPKRESGFTLMELIVVMALLAIISTALMGNFMNSAKKARDGRRKQDLDNIAKSLELYYNDNSVYPTSIPLGGSFEETIDGKTVTYMKSVPNDPINGFQYAYETDAKGTYFLLYACLENNQDPKRIVPTGSPDCGSKCSSCDYGIASSNANPCNQTDCPTPVP